jgi:hypothetical protein
MRGHQVDHLCQWQGGLAVLGRETEPVGDQLAGQLDLETDESHQSQLSSCLLHQTAELLAGAECRSERRVNDRQTIFEKGLLAGMILEES